MTDSSDTRPKNPPEKPFNIRCPRLGDQIEFSYCRIENNGLPCFKALDCWHHYFDVHQYLTEALAPEEFEKTFQTRPQPKMFSLVDLIEKAKKVQDRKD